VIWIADHPIISRYTGETVKHQLQHGFFSKITHNWGHLVNLPQRLTWALGRLVIQQKSFGDSAEIVTSDMTISINRHKDEALCIWNPSCLIMVSTKCSLITILSRKVWLAWFGEQDHWTWKSLWKHEIRLIMTAQYTTINSIDPLRPMDLLYANSYRSHKLSVHHGTKIDQRKALLCTKQ